MRLLKILRQNQVFKSINVLLYRGQKHPGIIEKILGHTIKQKKPKYKVKSLNKIQNDTNHYYLSKRFLTNINF